MGSFPAQIVLAPLFDFLISLRVRSSKGSWQEAGLQPLPQAAQLHCELGLTLEVTAGLTSSVASTGQELQRQPAPRLQSTGPSAQSRL